MITPFDNVLMYSGGLAPWIYPVPQKESEAFCGAGISTAPVHLEWYVLIYSGGLAPWIYPVLVQP
jgi:hypothetical protein